MPTFRNFKKFDVALERIKKKKELWTVSTRIPAGTLHRKLDSRNGRVGILFGGRKEDKKKHRTKKNASRDARDAPKTGNLTRFLRFLITMLFVD